MTLHVTSRSLRILTVPLLALALLLALTACGDEETAGPERGADVRAVDEQPTRLLGHTVTISAEVEQVFGPRAFALATPEQERPELEGLLVVTTAEAGGVTVEAGEVVRVTGEVRHPFSIAEVEQELGIADLDHGDEEVELAFYMGQEYVAATEVGRVREPEVEAAP